MRLFLALWPDVQVRDGLFDAARACHAQCRGRLVPAANLHATLAFLGEVDASCLPALVALVEQWRPAAFDLTLDRLGYFRRSRIVYAGAGDTPPALMRLAADCSSSLANAGFRTEDRPYTVHVTLLREARVAPIENAPALALMWHVRHIVLAESVRGRDGPVYRPLRRFMLHS